MLPQIDQSYLEERLPGSTVQSDGSMIGIQIPDFQLPPGLTADRTNLLLRFSPGYPDVPPDMWWFSPPVVRRDGATIQATEMSEVHFGVTWQRWSRHFQQGQWRSGVDSLESYIALIRSELIAAARDRAA